MPIIIRQWFTTLVVLAGISSHPAYTQLPTTAAGGEQSFTFPQLLTPGPEYGLLKSMVGTWKVSQRVWTGQGATPSTSPPFIAHRQLMGNFLQEKMEAISGSGVDTFTRFAYFTFNNASHHWETIVIDTRYPILMYETSFDNTEKNDNEFTVYLPEFIVPPFNKEMGGQLGRERRVITVESPDRNVVRQYWTLPGGKEYLAFEYVYTRQQ
jgi:Protein of unknown function (DUF1579)